MSDFDIKLLDCTLRDGGYINNWKWGEQESKAIIWKLYKAGVDIIEVGFLRNIDKFNSDIMVSDKIEDLNELLPKASKNIMYAAMAMQSNYDVNKLSDYSGNGIELIRVTAHDYDINEGLELAKIIINKGYKVSINPINIMGYSDTQILEIISKVNDINPYQFSIVDTFGSMKRRDLDRIISLTDNNLNKNIRLALHLHENMSLSCCLGQQFIDKHLQRPIAIDGSLMGMGRIPGNLPIELIADYLNDYANADYDIDSMLDAVQDYILKYKGDSAWGYTPAYFLSARYNVHRNYAEYLLEKGDVTNRDINNILSKISANKSTVFDADYVETLYASYKNNAIDDSSSLSSIKSWLNNKNVLIIAPGSSIVTYENDINRFIDDENPVVISVNFVPESFDVDIAFFSNNKRFYQNMEHKGKIVVTSNVVESGADYILNYNTLGQNCKVGTETNSLLLVLKMLETISVGEVYIAGADGYQNEAYNYYKTTISTKTEPNMDHNIRIANLMKKISVVKHFITPSMYERL